MDEGLYNPSQSCNLLKIFYLFSVFCLSIIDLYCCVALKMDSKVIHLHIYIYLFCYMYIYVREC